MEPRLRASYEQFILIVDFMESHGDLSRPVAGFQGRQRSEYLWQELTSILNSTGSGVNKPTERWKRYRYKAVPARVRSVAEVWSDWKTKTKRKAALVNRDLHGTGGGPSNAKPLTTLEERVMQIIGVGSISGLQGVEEAGLEIPQQQEQGALLIVNPLVDTTEAGPSNLEDRRATPTSALDTPAQGASNRIAQERSPVLRSSTPPPAHHGQHRRHRQAPFDRATSEFVALERSRLRHAREAKARWQELESRRLHLDAERIEVERKRIRVEAQRVRIEKDRQNNEIKLIETIEKLNTSVLALLSKLPK